MRAKQFVPIVEAQQELFEVNMSPGNLKKLSKDIDALVGIEFEMIVPNVGVIDSDYDESEEDMSYDRSAGSISDIIEFFDDADYNFRSEIRDLENELLEKFDTWRSDQISEEWESSDGKEYFAKWVKENVDPDDVADHADTPEDLFGDRIPDKDDWEKFIEDEWEDRGIVFDKAYEEFYSEKIDEDVFDEESFLDDIGIDDMSDVPSRVRTHIMWPYWSSPDESDAEFNLEQVADEFSKAIGRRVHYSTGYHGGPRTSDAYTVEPDSSLSGSGDDAGLEFISPPLPLDEILEDIKKVKEWADERGAFTNRSTGLHMNISVPGFNQEKLDFVKLTLLLGDKYLLDRFGRSANSYCKSAMDIIEEAPTIQDKELLFKKLKDNLETMASKVIHSGRVAKFTSINPKENRVEFRGPGGDWLGQNFDKIEDTLYRCVVALDAAVDPEKYRKEYLKKLTKMFDPRKDSMEDVFVQYAAGTITRSELKARIKAAQAQRKQEKLSKEGVVELEFYDAKPGDYIIEYDNPTGDNRRMFLKRTEQVDTPEKAMEAAMKLEPSWFKPDDIENIIVTEFSGKKEYNVFDKDGKVVGNYSAWTPLHAIDIMLSYDERIPKQDLTAKLASEYQPPERTYQTSSGTTARLAPGEELYIVRNNDTGHEVTLAAGSEQNARGRAIRNNPHNFTAGADITVTLARPKPENVGSAPSLAPSQREPGQEYNLYRVRGNGNSEYVSARSVSEAGRIALTAFPNLGDRSADLDIVLQDADPNVVAMYRRAQEDAIDRRNNLRGTMDQLGAGEMYIVTDTDGVGGVRFRANSPEHAIERARAAFNLPADRELIARLDND